MKARIYADFNNCTENYKVRLNSVGSRSDIDKVTTALVEGEIVILYNEEFEVEGRLELTQDGSAWMAVPDWSSRRARRRRIKA